MRKNEIITPYTLKNSFYMEACNIFKTPLGLLTDGSPYGAYDIELSANDNDATTLAFSLMGDSPKLSWLVNENLVLMDGEYYIIKRISMEDGGISLYRFECEHEICSYKEKFNSKIDLVGKSPEELITAVCTNTTDRLPIRFGGTDIRNKYRHLQSEETSVFANLVTIAEVFNARLKFVNIQGIIHVWLLANPKDKGRFIEKKRDLDKVNLEYDSTEMYTRLHYFGGTDDVGNEITMHSENPTGKSYIEDFSYWLNQGYKLEDVKANPNCIKELTIRNAELTTSKQVYEMALQEMENICRPKLNATVSLIDLQMYKCYNLEPIEIGDLVRVYDKTKNLHLEATIVGINKNGNNPLDISINLSNVIEINSALKDLVGTSQVVDKITNGGNMVQGTYVKIGNSSLDIELFEYKKQILGHTTQINENKASIEANSKEIALKVNESEYKSDKETINDRITDTELKLVPGTITATVTEHKTFTDKVGAIADEETKKQLDAYKTTVDKEFTDVINAINSAKDYVDGAFKDGILTEAEKEGIKVQINQIDVEEKDIAKQYTAIYNHSLLINKATLKQAYDGYIKTDNDLTSFLNSMLLLTNIEIGHVTEKDRLFTMYKEKLGAIKDKINLALDEIALNRTNNLESNVENRFATLEIDLDGVTTTVGKHTETINTNTQQITSNKDLAQQQADKAKADANDFTITQVKTVTDKVAEIKVEADKISQSVETVKEQVVTIDGQVKDKITLEQAKAEITVESDKIKSEIATSGGGNLLNNTGFDCGLNGWEHHAYQWQTGVDITYWTGSNEWILNGTRAIVINSKNPELDGEIGRTQTFKMKKNQNYCFSVLVAAHRATGRIIIRDSKMGWLTAINFDESHKGGKYASDWKRITIPFNSGNNDQSRVDLVMTSSGSNGHVWFCQPMLNEGLLPQPWIERSPSSNLVTQELTSTSITNKVQSQIANGGAINVTSMKLDSNGIETLHGGYRTMVSNGWSTSYDLNGNWTNRIGRTFDVYNGKIGSDFDYVGGLRAEYSSGKKYMGFLADADVAGFNFTYTMGGGGSDDKGSAVLTLPTSMSRPIYAYVNLDMDQREILAPRINFSNSSMATWLNSIYISSNTLDTNYSSGNLVLNYNRGVNSPYPTKCYVNDGGGGGNRGIIYVKSVDTRSGLSQRTATQRGDKKSLGVTAMKDTIEDMFFGVINSSGTSTIVFNQDFIAQADTSVKYHVQVTGYDGGTFKIERFEDRLKLTGAIGEEFSVKVTCFTRNQLSAHIIPIEEDTMKDEVYRHNELQDKVKDRLGKDDKAKDACLGEFLGRRKARYFKNMNIYLQRRVEFHNKNNESEEV